MGHQSFSIQPLVNAHSDASISVSLPSLELYDEEEAEAMMVSKHLEEMVYKRKQRDAWNHEHLMWPI